MVAVESLKEDGGNLVGAVSDLVGAVVFGRGQMGEQGDCSPSVLQRSMDAWANNGPRLKRAAKSVTADVYDWTSQGGPWRAFFITTMGIVSLIALTGLTTFMLFFVAATINAIIIALLMTTAAVGAFAGLFFASLTAIYVGAISVAVFVISSMTFLAICAIVFTAGWIGFWWSLWLGAKQSLKFVRYSVGRTAPDPPLNHKF